MIVGMAKDPNEFSRLVLDQITANHNPKASRDEGKDAQEVAAGIRGGAKGGLTRAQNLLTKKQKSIASKTAKTRWSNH